MRTWLLALPFLLAGATAADAAVVERELKVTITEVVGDELNVDQNDVFSGTIRFDSDELATTGVSFIEAFRLDFGGTEISEADAADPKIFDFGTGLQLSLEVSDIDGVFDSEVPLTFAGMGPNMVAFSDDDGPVVTGEFSVVPVPAALPLLATGLAGLAWLRRRQRG